MESKITAIHHKSVSETVLIGHLDGSLKIKTAGKEIIKKPSEFPITAVKIINSNNFITGDFDGNLNYISLSTKSLNAEKNEKSNDDIIKSLRFTDGILDLTVNDKNIFVLTSDLLKSVDLNTFNIEKEIKISGCKKISGNETHLAISCNTNKILLYDNQLNLLKEFTGSHAALARENAFGILCLVIGEKKRLKIYEEFKGEFLCYEKEMDQEIQSVSISEIGFIAVIEFRDGLKGFVVKNRMVSEVEII
ncbi:hypothetical protein CDIK_0753 [Cucumispora dikerogammari]|nr:hypothetical protein CDIK_0753 [Cucumispora dikerogammari]